MSPSLLLTDCTGSIGRLVLQELEARGVASRVLDPSGAVDTEGASPLVDRVDGDPAIPESLDSSLDGIERVLLVTPPSPEQVLLQGNVIEAIERTGRAIHVVTVSALGALPPGAPLQVAQWQAVTEAQLENSGLPTTVLHPHFLMQSLLRTAPSIRSYDMLCGSFDRTRLPLVDGRDVARVIATLLTTEGHHGRRYDITGPQLLSFPDVAEIFSRILGRSIRYVDMPIEMYHEYLVGLGIPNWIADDLTILARSFREGYELKVSSDVALITGRPAETLADFIRDHVDLFRPSPAPPAVEEVHGSPADADFWSAMTFPPNGPPAHRPPRAS